MQPPTHPGADGPDRGGAEPEINALTLATADMARAVSFYEAVGMKVTYGGAASSFTTLSFGSNFVNLTMEKGPPSGFWGRVIFHVPSPDDLWRSLADAGYQSMTEPADATWGERYFHIHDPDGHELSFARRLDSY